MFAAPRSCALAALPSSYMASQLANPQNQGCAPGMAALKEEEEDLQFAEEEADATSTPSRTTGSEICSLGSGGGVPAGGAVDPSSATTAQQPNSAVAQRHSHLSPAAPSFSPAVHAVTVATVQQALVQAPEPEKKAQGTAFLTAALSAQQVPWQQEDGQVGCAHMRCLCWGG